MSEAEDGGPHERTVGPPCVNEALLYLEIGDAGDKLYAAAIRAELDRLRAEVEALRAENEEMKHTLRQIEKWDTAADTERDAGKPVLHDMPIALWHQIQKHLTPNASFSGAGTASAGSDS
jgi:hypothetical protein